MKVYEKMKITITDLSKIVDEAANFGREPMYAEGGASGSVSTGNLKPERFTLISVS